MKLTCKKDLKLNRNIFTKGKEYEVVANHLNTIYLIGDEGYKQILHKKKEEVAPKISILSRNTQEEYYLWDYFEDKHQKDIKDSAHNRY